MNEANNGLIDIVEPAMPTATGVNWLWISVAIVIVMVLFALWMVWKKWPAWLALKQLRNLQQKITSGELTQHEGVLMLALELRHGLGLRRLRAAEAPAGCRKQDGPRWLEFMGKLDAELYQHAPEPDAVTQAALFEQAAYWLRRYSRRTKLKKIGS